MADDSAGDNTCLADIVQTGGDACRPNIGMH